MTQKEILLTGGNVNASVVRIGNTVRRHMTSASPAIHQLLLHLESKGFAGSPRFLGIDEKNREILSFVDGDTGIPTSIWQRYDALIAAANLLRAYHDATLDFTFCEHPVWAYSYPLTEHHEVICHNDFAPYNFVYNSGRPIAVIDFDLAGPGPRLRDVAYAAYWIVPLSFNSTDQLEFVQADLKNGSHRLHLFCETYGIPVGEELLNMIAEVLAHMSSEEKMQQVLGTCAAAKLKDGGHLAHWQRELMAFQQNRSCISI
ncbi:MAG: aminoglycoside phosphotransferase family protein [Chloroflexota bacterium]